MFEFLKSVPKTEYDPVPGNGRPEMLVVRNGNHLIAAAIVGLIVSVGLGFLIGYFVAQSTLGKSQEVKKVSAAYLEALAKEDDGKAFDLLKSQVKSDFMKTHLE